MRQDETRDFSKYVVYGVNDDTHVHELCLCENINIAIFIAKQFAKNDSDHDKYYVTNVEIPGTFTPGGGWYKCYYLDEEGKLCQDNLD